MSFDLGDYNDVASRIVEFRQKHPEGVLQSEIIPLPTAFADSFIAVRACAYRTPQDERPGIGLAYEPVPGKTNFTRDSELQNAETAAWGRAIIAVGAADAKKGIASREEVQNRQSWDQSDQSDRGDRIKLAGQLKRDHPNDPRVQDGNLRERPLDDLLALQADLGGGG